MIKVFQPKLRFSDKLEVLKTLQKNNISGTSPIVEEFEQALATRFDRKFGIAVSNGTVALEVSLKALNLQEGDEVVLPSFTIISCLSSVIRAGLKPVFCDVDRDTWNMKLENVKEVITEKTKAVLIVHTYGLPCEAKAISDYCNNRKIKIIEDSAEAHGIQESNIKCGSFGDLSTFSFYANKHITTGEGGCILTDSKDTYNLIKSMINLDFKEPNRFNHENLYWNYRLSGIQAALGISQIKNLSKVIEMKIQQGKQYNLLLSNLKEDIQLPLESTEGGEFNNYWVYGLVLKNSIDRDFIRSYLYDNKIETREFFWPLHLQNSTKDNNNVLQLTNSEYLGKQGFYIPLGSHINFEKQKYIATKIKEGISKFK